ALLRRAPRRAAHARRAAGEGLGLRRDAGDAHGRRARGLAEAEAGGEPVAAAALRDGARAGLQVHGLTTMRRAPSSSTSIEISTCASSKAANSSFGHSINFTPGPASISGMPISSHSRWFSLRR